MSDTARSQYLFTRGLTTAKIVYPKYIRDLMLSNIMLAIRSFSREETWKEGKTRTKVILRSIGTKTGSYLSAVRPFSRCWRARPIVTTTLFQKLHRMRLSKTQLYLDTFVRTTASDMCQGFIKEHVTSGRFIFAADLWRLRPDRFIAVSTRSSSGRNWAKITSTRAQHVKLWLVSKKVKKVMPQSFSCYIHSWECRRAPHPR